MRFFFHIRDGHAFVRDDDGTEFLSVGEAVDEAVRTAREILAGRLVAGRPLGVQSFEIHDEAGTLVQVIPFKGTIPRD